MPVSLTPTLSRKQARGQTNRCASFALIRMAHHKQPVSVLVVIYTVEPGADLEVLLLERADHAGYWQSVTGSCEVGETPLQTALREVREETGLDALQYSLTDWQLQNIYEIYPQWRHRYSPDTTLNTEHVFGLQLPHAMAVEIAPGEHLGYQWLSWQDAAAKVFSPSNRAAILQIPLNPPFAKGGDERRHFCEVGRERGGLGI